jgi:hypothetical protein
MDSKDRKYVLNDLGLPSHLVEMIQDGTLHSKIDAAYERYEKSVALLDAWEASNPAAAPLAPWFQAREAWKSAGRPKPEWYEVLWQQQNMRLPIKKTEIEQNLLMVSNVRRKRECMQRKRAKKNETMHQVR